MFFLQCTYYGLFESVHLVFKHRRRSFELIFINEEHNIWMFLSLFIPWPWWELCIKRELDVHTVCFDLSFALHASFTSNLITFYPDTLFLKPFIRTRAQVCSIRFGLEFYHLVDIRLKCISSLLNWFNVYSTRTRFSYFYPLESWLLSELLHELCG